MQHDLLGTAIHNFWIKKDNTPVEIWINNHKEPPMFPEVFFRKFPSMLGYEKHVMKLVNGKVLDMGCAAGCHSHYLMFRRGLKTIGVEASEKSSKIAKSRGLDVINSNWQQVKLKNFDHIFALMNGMGLAQSLAELDKLLRKCKSMLKVGGVLWIDSTDVTYAKAFWPQTNTNYFGLVEFKLKYKGRTQKFPWLFVDRFTAMEKARKAGFSIENCRLERNGHYLLQLRKIS